MKEPPQQFPRGTASLLPGSPPAFKFLPREHEPTIVGEYIRILVQAAGREFPESRLLDLVERAGGGRHQSLEDLYQLLKPPAHAPNRFLLDFIRELKSLGLSQEWIGHHTFREARGSNFFLALVFSTVSYCTRTPLASCPRDLVSCGYLAHSDFARLVVNSTLVDACLEESEGPERLMRLSMIMLQPGEMKPEAAEHFQQAIRFMPLGFGESAAELEDRGGAQVWWTEDGLAEAVPLLVRPSLMELGERHGFSVRESDGEVFIDGVRAGVMDSSPRQVIGGDICRMLLDVRREGGRIKLQPPRGPCRRAEDFIALQDHHFSLRHALVYRDFYYRYRVRSGRQLLYVLGIKLGDLIWKTVGRRFIPNPGSLGFYTETMDMADRGQTPVNPLRFDQPDPARELLARQAAKRYGLTAREAEVLNFILQGHDNREIGRDLRIEPATVKTHISNVLSKSGMSNRRQLIASLLGTLPLAAEENQ